MKNCFPNFVLETPQRYRIKISGFQTSLTPASLAQLLGQPESQCYVNYHSEKIGYVVKLNSYKFAQRLMQTWHNKEIQGGQRLKCQIELNIFRPKSVQNDSHAARPSCPSSGYTSKSSRDSSPSKNEINLDRVLKTLSQHSAFTTERRPSSTESTTSSVDPKCKSFFQLN